MFKRTSIILSFLLILILTSCNLPDSSNVDQSAQQTAVAETVDAALPTVTETVEITEEATATTPSNGGASGGEDDVKFIRDVTIPDYTSVEIGAKFTKIWRLQNTGESTWTTGYKLVFDDGEKMGALDSISLPREVKPGETVDVSVDMVAPNAEGEYQGDWLLANENGVTFGLGDDNKPFWVLVNVVEKLQTGTGTGIAGGADISTVKLVVDSANYSGSCPPVIVFTWTITTSSDGVVQYTLNFNSNTSGFSFDPVDVISLTVNGPTTITRTYQFIPSNSVSGTAQAVATGSSTVISAPIGFTLTCN